MNIGGQHMDFDKMIKRRNTDSVKWDLAISQSHMDDLLPLWVADMDFAAPDCVVKALTNRAAHGIYGYTYTDEAYKDAIVNWMTSRHHWHIEKEWLLYTIGIVPAIYFAVHAFTEPGDSIIIQQPVYGPFSNAVIKNKRKLVNSSLIFNGGRYEMDFDDFEQKVIKNNVKLFILCSPHNPVGRVWTKEELCRIGDICVKHHVLVVSDEIHHDIVYKGNKHIPFASLGEEYANCCITCTSPGKTFNMAALQNANLIISNPEIRNILKTFTENLGLTEPGLMGMLACKTAYTEGHDWLDALLRYLNENKEYAKSYIQKNIPNIHAVDPEGTYLLWMDFKNTMLSDQELNDFLMKKAKVQLNAGTSFGEEGKGFMRLNFACPRSVLVQALERIEKAINSTGIY